MNALEQRMNAYMTNKKVAAGEKMARLASAKCRQTRLLLSSLIPRERYLCAEPNAGAFSEIPTRYHVS